MSDLNKEAVDALERIKAIVDTWNEQNEDTRTGLAIRILKNVREISQYTERSSQPTYRPIPILTAATT